MHRQLIGDVVHAERHFKPIVVGHLANTCPRSPVPGRGSPVDHDTPISLPPDSAWSNHIQRPAAPAHTPHLPALAVVRLIWLLPSEGFEGLRVGRCSEKLTSTKPPSQSLASSPLLVCRQ